MWYCDAGFFGVRCGITNVECDASFFFCWEWCKVLRRKYFLLERIPIEKKWTP
jgi:hypothetical protein